MEGGNKQISVDLMQTAWIILENKSSSSSTSSRGSHPEGGNQLGYIRFNEDCSPLPVLCEGRQVNLATSVQSSSSSSSVEAVKPPSSFAQMSASRRREFAEQFHDLPPSASDRSTVSWDDASRLFPTQFGISRDVAFNIW